MKPSQKVVLFLPAFASEETRDPLGLPAVPHAALARGIRSEIDRQVRREAPLAGRSRELLMKDKVVLLYPRYEGPPLGPPLSLMSLASPLLNKSFASAFWTARWIHILKKRFRDRDCRLSLHRDLLSDWSHDSWCGRAVPACATLAAGYSDHFRGLAFQPAARRDTRQRVRRHARARPGRKDASRDRRVSTP